MDTGALVVGRIKPQRAVWLTGLDMVNTLSQVGTPRQLKLAEYILRLASEPLRISLPAGCVAPLVSTASLLIVAPGLLALVLLTSTAIGQLRTAWM